VLQAVLGGKSGLGKFSLGLSGANTPYSSWEPNKSVIVNGQCGGEELKCVPKFCIGGTGHVISRMRSDDLHWSGILESHPKNGWRYTLGHNGARTGLDVGRYAAVWYTGTSLVGLTSYRHFFLANCHIGKP